jgi:2-keto-3-deoxy-L-rhamnonate aldolase RhmA
MTTDAVRTRWAAGEPPFALWLADRHGLVAGIHAPAPPRAAEMVARGFRFVSCAVDDDLLATAAAEAVRAARDTR